MKHLSIKDLALTMIGVVLFLLTLLSSPLLFAEGAMDDFSPDKIVAELKPSLDLNDQQVKDLTAALGEMGKTLHVLIEKEEANKEEDPNEFIKGVKQAQSGAVLGLVPPFGGDDDTGRSLLLDEDIRVAS